MYSKIQYFSFIYTRQMQTISEAAAYTLQFINQTHRSVFLTGKAGTGKPLLREIIQTTHKNTVVVAPTGIGGFKCWRSYDSLHVSIAV
jgi:tRNA A37 threonylcarbamoyladenosine biosynthesis protein TsaE